MNDRGKRVLLISGLVDIQKAGNQSFRNTVLGLARQGWQILVLSALPNFYPGLDDPKTVFAGLSVSFRRLPRILAWGFLLLRMLKNKGKRTELRRLGDGGGDYFGQYSPRRLLLYVVAAWCYAVFESIRGWWEGLWFGPSLVYGYEVNAVLPARFLAWIFRAPLVTRFQGTALDVRRLDDSRYCRSLWHHLVALKTPADLLIMANDGTRGNIVLHKLGVDQSRVRFWMNGLDSRILTTEWIRRSAGEAKERLGLPKDSTLILMVSKLKPWKRVERGIELMSRLRHSEAHLVVVGDGDQASALRSLAEELKIADRILFVGAKPYDQLGGFYRASALFLSLYDFSNLGNPLLEALYFGLPIVTIDDGSTEGLLVDGVNARLVPLEHLDVALPEVVDHLIASPSERLRLGMMARRTFEEKVSSWEDRMRMESAELERLIFSKGVPYHCR